MAGDQKGAKTFITSTYTDGSSGTKEIVNKKVSGQPVLVDDEGSDFGEYFLITTANRRSSGQSTKDCSTQKLAYTVKNTATSEPAVHSALVSRHCVAGLTRFRKNIKASPRRANH